MPNHQIGDRDDTASIRSAVSSIFPSFSSTRKGRRRPLSNLWVFTNTSRDNTEPQAGTTNRPQSNAACYSDSVHHVVDGRETPTTKSANPWQLQQGFAPGTPLAPILDGDTTPTSAQTSIPSTPLDIGGVSCLRGNGKLLRARSSALNSPSISNRSSPTTTPKTTLFAQSQTGNPNSGIGGEDRVPVPKQIPSVTLPLKKDIKRNDDIVIRKTKSKEEALSIAQEVDILDLEETPSEYEKNLPGLSTTTMDDLIEGLRPKKARSRGDIRSQGPHQRNQDNGFQRDVERRLQPGRVSSRDLTSIAAELSRGKVVPVRFASRPQNGPQSIDDIVKRHANEAPEVFGLSRKAVDQIPACRNGQADDILDEAIMTRDLMLQRLESKTVSISSGSTVSLQHIGPPVPPKPQRYYATTTSSDTWASLSSSTSWESLKRKMANDDDPDRIIAKYLKSRRLNRIISLTRPGQAGQVLSVAEVGNPEGYPVLVFLGLGCVRYLIALYDEVARAENIRLICIDRWGLGKSQDVDSERRGLLKWADVVKEIMDQMAISKFGVVAHSAGVPYAMATALRMKERVNGTIHLLAPWVNIEIDGGYKWLKYVPSSVIKTAQATEWKLHGWRLGSLPASPSDGIGYTTPKSARSVMETASGYFVGRLGPPHVSPSPSPIYSSESLSRWSSSKVNLGVSPRSDRGSEVPRQPPVSPLVRPRSSASRLVRSVSKRLKPNEDLLLRLRDSRNLAQCDTYYASPNASDSTFETEEMVAPLGGRISRMDKIVPTRTTSLPSIDLARQESRAQSSASTLSSPVPLTGESSLATAILRASHSEALPGGTADLLAILGKDSKDWGFSYTHIEHPCQVWLGEKDDKIGDRGVRWMEREMKRCRVEIVENEGHNLLASGFTMLKVFAALQEDGQAWSPQR